MKIFVDADACPVKDIIIQEGAKVHIPIVMVKSFSHFSHDDNHDGVETVYVDAGADAADYRIMQLAQAGDIIVTQDYGLAALALGKGCSVIHHMGFTYTTQNIEQLLTNRHINAKARKSGLRTKGPKALTKDDMEKFREVLTLHLK